MPRAVLKDVLCAFSPRGDQFAITTGDGRVKCWSVSDGRVVSEFTELSADAAAAAPLPNGHLSLDYSTISWGVVSKQGSKKKRSLLVLGSRNGDVVAWDPAVGEVKWRIADCNPGGVGCVAFGTEGHVYVAGADGMVCEVEPSSGELGQKFRASKNPISAIAISPDGTRILIGTSELKLLNLTTRKRLRRFSGHTNFVKAVAFTQDGKLILSCAVGDRHIAVWDCEGSGKGSRLTLPMEHPPVSVDSTGFGKDGAVLRIAALSETGESYVWSGADLEELGKASPVRITVASKQYVMLARFLNSDAVTVARGTTVKPIFETVALENQRGVLVLEAVKDGALLPSHKKQAVDTNADEVTVLGADNAAEARMLKKVEGASSNKKKRRAPSEAQEKAEQVEKTRGDPEPSEPMQEAEGEQTMEERLRELGIIGADDDEGKPSGSTDAVLPKTDALDVLLTQALQSEDDRLLQQCLFVSDDKVITKTVRQLKGTDAAKLFKAAMTRLESGSKKVLNLLPWIRTVLLEHAATIVADSSLQPVLTSLYQMIDARLHMFMPLLSLSGRLDLIMAQINTNEEFMKNAGDNAAAVIYEEEDSEQEAEDAMAEDESEQDEDDEEQGDDDAEQGQDEDQGQDEQRDADDAMQEDTPQENGGIGEDDDDDDDEDSEDEGD